MQQLVTSGVGVTDRSRKAAGAFHLLLNLLLPSIHQHSFIFPLFLVPENSQMASVNDQSAVGKS